MNIFKRPCMSVRAFLLKLLAGNITVVINADIRGTLSTKGNFVGINNVIHDSDVGFMYFAEIGDDSDK